MEGMTYLIEDHLFPKSRETKWFVPYDLPEIVAKQIYPVIGDNPAYIVALCDMSLMYYHPGEVFIKILNIMRENQFVPINLYDIYNFVKDNLKIPGTNFRMFWNEVANHTIKDIVNLVNIDMYIEARDWAVQSIEYYYSLRSNDIAYISNLMTLSPLVAKTQLFLIFKDKTSPLIYNNNMQLGIIAGNDISDDKKGKLIYWYNLSKFYDYLFCSDKKDCPFRFFCKISEKCRFIKNPWKRKGWGYCFFQQYSRMLALYKRNIV
jgi:hypothetical protein